MTSTDSIEATASTVNEAISRALDQLGAHADDVTIEVLSTPRSGVLGLGSRPARVRVTRLTPAAARSTVQSPPPAPPLKRTPPELSRQSKASPESRAASGGKILEAGESEVRGATPDYPIEPGDRDRAEAATDESPASERRRRVDSRIEQDERPRRDPPNEGRRRAYRSDNRRNDGSRQVRERTSQTGPTGDGDRDESASGEIRSDDAPRLRQTASNERSREGGSLPPRENADSDLESLSDESSNADQRELVVPEEQISEAIKIAAEILKMMGEKATIETVRDEGLQTVELNIRGDGSGILIGRHGQTLDALEYIVNRVLARRIKDAISVSIDTESYRARRRGQLHRMALSKGEQAKREHITVRLDPMPPRDRRIVHLALKDDPLIMTRSFGDGFLRSIEIVPVDNSGDREPNDRGGRERRGHGRDSSRDREEDDLQIGQHGGFKHGQKRIV
jgi:spoIIIJ-associated protein